jgi:hypothetical protein
MSQVELRRVGRNFGQKRSRLQLFDMEDTDLICELDIRLAIHNEFAIRRDVVYRSAVNNVLALFMICVLVIRNGKYRASSDKTRGVE